MNARRLAAVLALVALVAGLWWWRGHTRSSASSPGAGAAGDAGAAAVVGARATAPPVDQDPAPAWASVQEDDDAAGLLRLEGQVIDEHEAPVAGAVVILEARPPRRVKTEDDGSFVFERLSPRTYLIAARKGAAVGGPVGARVAAGSDPVILRLRTGGTLEATVLDASTRAPIVGAQVELMGPLGVSAATDALGIARLEGIDAGITNVQVSAPGRATLVEQLAFAGAPGAVERRTFLLETGGSVAGRVFDPSGTGAAGARVRALPAGTLAIGAASALEVTCDAQGRFRIEGLGVGAYRFEARHAQHAPARSPLVRIDPAARDVQGVEIHLVAGGTLAGLVVDAGGQPVAGAAVTVELLARAAWAPEPPRRTFTDEQGSFELRGLPRQSLAVLAHAEGQTSAVVPVSLEAQPERRDLRLQLEAESELSGIVVDERGEPVPEAQVLAVQASGDAEAMLGRVALDVADAGGRFRLLGLRPGDYLLRATRPGATRERLFEERGQPVRVPARDVRVVLAAGARVRGQVAFSDGGHPDVFTVAVGLATPRPFASADGRFELEDVSPGNVALQVAGPGFARKTVSVNVPPGAVADAGVIQVVRGRSIAGRVIDESGRAVAGARVLAASTLMGDGQRLGAPLGLGGSFGVQETTTDDRGEFVLPGLGAAALSIAAELAGRGRSAVVAIPPGEEGTRVELVLQAGGALTGRVTRAGQAVPGVIVTAAARRGGRNELVVGADADGAFAFAQLTPGEYVVAATLLASEAGVIGGTSASVVVEVKAGGEARADIELPGGDIRVVVGLQGPRATNAQVQMLSGEVAATNAAKLDEAVLGRGAGWSLLRFTSTGDATFSATPGKATVCVVPLPGPVTDMAVAQRLQDDPASLPALCSSVVVRATPPEQRFEVVVPGP